jgi:hypothetical protein
MCSPGYHGDALPESTRMSLSAEEGRFLAVDCQGDREANSGLVTAVIGEEPCKTREGL